MKADLPIKVVTAIASAISSHTSWQLNCSVEEGRGSRAVWPADLTHRGRGAEYQQQ